MSHRTAVRRGVTRTRSPFWLLVLVSRLPLAVLYLAARVLALSAFHVIRYRRTATERLLAGAFPDLRPPRLSALTKRYYCHIADIVVEIVKGYSISREELERRVRFTNFDLLDRFLAKQQSFILIGSHGANWEWVSLACSARLPCSIDVVYKELRDIVYGTFMAAMRSRFGANLIERSGGLLELAKGQNRLRAIAMVVDHAPAASDACHWVRFLNQDTAFQVDFERLARLWNCPVVHAARRRVGRGRYEVTFEILGEPPYADPVYTIVERFAASLECSIRANPEDWFWHRRRWKRKRPFYA